MCFVCVCMRVSNVEMYTLWLRAQFKMILDIVDHKWYEEKPADNVHCLSISWNIFLVLSVDGFIKYVNPSNALTLNSVLFQDGYMHTYLSFTFCVWFHAFNKQNNYSGFCASVFATFRVVCICCVLSPLFLCRQNDVDCNEHRQMYTILFNVEILSVMFSFQPNVEQMMSHTKVLNIHEKKKKM